MLDHASLVGVRRPARARYDTFRTLHKAATATAAADPAAATATSNWRGCTAPARRCTAASAAPATRRKGWRGLTKSIRPSCITPRISGRRSSCRAAANGGAAAASCSAKVVSLDRSIGTGRGAHVLLVKGDVGIGVPEVKI